MHEQLEKLVELATSERYLNRIRDAKDRFFKRTGEVFEDDPFYELRMQGFVEYYLFDYAANSVPDTLDLILEDYKDDLSAKETDTYIKFRRGTHSLFELKKAKGEKFSLLNLWDGKKVEVYERRAMHGVDKKDLFEARLLPYEDQLYFSNAFVFHPKQVKKFIMRIIKDAQTEQGDRRLATLHQLAHLRLKFDRYHGMNALKIYSNETIRQWITA